MMRRRTRRRARRESAETRGAPPCSTPHRPVSASTPERPSAQKARILLTRRTLTLQEDRLDGRHAQNLGGEDKQVGAHQKHAAPTVRRRRSDPRSPSLVSHRVLDSRRRDSFLPFRPNPRLVLPRLAAWRAWTPHRRRWRPPAAPAVRARMPPAGRLAPPRPRVVGTDRDRHGTQRSAASDKGQTTRVRS